MKRKQKTAVIVLLLFAVILITTCASSTRTVQSQAPDLQPGEPYVILSVGHDIEQIRFMGSTEVDWRNITAVYNIDRSLIATAVGMDLRIWDVENSRLIRVIPIPSPGFGYLQWH